MNEILSPVLSAVAKAYILKLHAAFRDFLSLFFALSSFKPISVSKISLIRFMDALAAGAL